MLRPYEEVIDAISLLKDPNLKKFADALRVQIQAEYQEIFGLGDILAQRRLELNLSQVQLAKRSGLTQEDISRLERGNGNPTLFTIKKLLGALQLKLAVQRDEPNGDVHLKAL